MEHKIFCIGVNKTGTSSLHEAFQILGLRSLHNVYKANALIEAAIQANQKLLLHLDEYDAFSDHPFFRYYQDLDLQYPGSKFILNTRDSKRWVESRIKHDQRWHEKNPDKPPRVTDEQKLLRYKESVEAGIRTYFRDRPDDFMEFDVEAGDGWTKLCSFLQMSTPDQSFPHANVAPLRLAGRADRL